eukprot:GFKZ01000499.1.p1 GENE.GFKZ01000499.1~~GFKZ01000499.1.p1  ORF type:complete len:347 (-),score=71.12 GFKZ01000499.1:96-1136(-)
MTTDTAPSLDTLFARAVSKLHEVDDIWTGLSLLSRTPAPARRSGPAAPDAAVTAVKQLMQVSVAVSQASLLSANEALDEIPTGSLKYLLVPYLIARAHGQIHGEAHERHAALVESRRWLNSFFERMDRLGLLSERDRDAALEHTPTQVVSAGTKREMKIARFKKEKETERKLSLLRERMGVAGGDDEEMEREITLVIVESGVGRAMDFLDGLEQEMEVLRFAVRQLEKGVDPREKAERMRPKGPVPGLGGMPPSFRIVSERERVRQGVFRPSHSLPTYTVEEWGRIERERMIRMEREKREKDVVAAKRREEEDSDGEEAVERERLEKSRWDDWKDEHNKGSGNTIR